MFGPRNLGLLLLTTGFFGAAFLAVRRADAAGLEWDTIEWPWYLGMFLVGVAGVVLMRITAKSVDTHAHKLDADIGTIESSITAVVNRLQAMIREQDSIDVYDIHGRIDDELLEDLGAFADARESMGHRFGLHAYAEVMTKFALGERNINRAWSASADGYIDEVWASIARAEKEMSRAQSLLRSLQEKMPLS